MLSALLNKTFPSFLPVVSLHLPTGPLKTCQYQDMNPVPTSPLAHSTKFDIFLFQPQKNRQQELKLQLEAELKQQQLNLKLMRRKQKEKSDDHHPSSEQPVASTSSSSSMATASTSHITSHSSSPTSLKLHISKSLIQVRCSQNCGGI